MGPRDPLRNDGWRHEAPGILWRETWAVVRREFLRRNRVTGRVLSSALDQHIGDAPSAWRGAPDTRPPDWTCGTSAHPRDGHRGTRALDAGRQPEPEPPRKVGPGIRLARPPAEQWPCRRDARMSACARRPGSRRPQGLSGHRADRACAARHERGDAQSLRPQRTT